jgi:GT2 family glycosyltransferase/glycosyltransferase involved in cell wall biosynthesis
MNTGSATEAWSRGLEPGGLPWLERAARLAPHDPRIGLNLAQGLLAAGRAAEAAVAFEAIAQRFDEVAAWFGLLLARRALGESAAAAAALGALLARHCVPEVQGFAALADQVAAAAGYKGWRGFDAAGRRVGGGRRALGPADRQAVQRVDGIVSWTAAGLEGWACRPALQTMAPRLVLTDSNGKRRQIRFGDVLPGDDEAPFLQRYSFRVPTGRLRGLVPPLRLCGPDGRDIFGSPVALLDAAAADVAPAVLASIPRRRGLAVVMPVYRDFGVTQACLESLFTALDFDAAVIVVDDATPEPDLAAWLDSLGARITLIRHAQNRGFVAAANAGLREAGGRDVLLLNSDTLVPPGAIEVLQHIAYASPATGSVTPFSNEATILSYPKSGGGNAAPDLAGTVALNNLAFAANRHRAVPIPTAIGFCMYIRHDCLTATGLLREDAFAQGYGEENDWCRRAAAFGYQHMAAPGAYVAHVSGLSFGSAGRALTRRNLGILNRLHPGYDETVANFTQANPLQAHRRRLDVRRLLAGQAQAQSVLLITHNHGGGVARQVEVHAGRLRAAGKRPLLLLPAFPADPLATPYPWPATITEHGFDDYPNLRFNLPPDGRALRRLLRCLRVTRVEMHHMLGHCPEIRGLAAALDVPQDVVIHDYACFCPRINLLTRPDQASPWRYCGEPDVTGCEACIARAGDGELFESVSVRAVLERSTIMLRSAARVITPSRDAARRISRHFPGITPEVTPWEDDAEPVRLRPPRNGPRRIITIGGIGPAKGFDVLRDCARDAAARDLPLAFIIAGSSAEDHELLETGRIFITGLAPELDLPAMLRRLDGDLAFLPSIWPETWCFALSEAWRAGLYSIMFDLGAPAARLAATGRGATIPLGLPPARINDYLLRWRPSA